MPAPIVYDIETSPRDLDSIKSIHGPYDPASDVGPRPGAFDQASVKLGNLKDANKIAEKIEAARAAHEERIAGYDQALADAEAKHWAGVVDRAALCPTTGCVMAIGYLSDAGEVIHHEAEYSEATMLEQFWVRYLNCRAKGRRLIGFNSHGFDLPFIARRSWMLGVAVPQEAQQANGYLDPTFFDLVTRFQFGNRRDYISLDKLCRAMGLHGKPEGVTGAMFHAMYRDPEQRAAALAYLSNDLRMTWELAERMGVL